MLLFLTVEVGAPSALISYEVDAKGGVAVMKDFELLTIILTLISLILYVLFRCLELALMIAK